MSEAPDSLPADFVHSVHSVQSSESEAHGMIYPRSRTADNSFSPADVIIVRTGEQLKQYMTIRFDVFIKEQGIDPSSEIDEYDGEGVDVIEANKKAVHFLALVDGMPAGAGRLLLLPGEVCKVTRIATAPQFRKRGVGQAIMLAIHATAVDLGYKFCKLGAQLSAVPFYQKLNYGIVPPGDEFLDAGIPHKWMQVKIN